MEPTAAHTPLLSEKERRIVRLCLAAMGVLSSGSMLGVAFSPYLVNHYPLLLVALSPLGRHVWLVAPIVDPVAFVVVVGVRRLLFYGASYHLGRALGPQGIPWIERRAAWFGRFVRWLERLFARAARAVVFAMAGPTVSALAGISRMPGREFAGFAASGLMLRLLIVLGIAGWLRPYIEVVLAWIDRYWVPGTVLMVALVLLYAWKGRGRVPSIGT
jgi:membrane protein DedA with SNARE-associated domain